MSLAEHSQDNIFLRTQNRQKVAPQREINQRERHIRDIKVKLNITSVSFQKIPHSSANANETKNGE